MPSWPIHLALANKINKKLNLGDEFIIGNIMPDILNGYEINDPSQLIDKSISHFRSNNGKIKTIDLDYFISIYKENLNNPFILGYFVHLITDKYFNDYTFRHHIVLMNNQKYTILKDGTISKDFTEKPWEIKQNDFHIYDQKLINDGLFNGISMNYKNNINIKECPINEDDFNKAINKINTLKDNIKPYDKNKYKMFTEQELDKLYEECYEYILNKLKLL